MLVYVDPYAMKNGGNKYFYVNFFDSQLYLFDEMFLPREAWGLFHFNSMSFWKTKWCINEQDWNVQIYMSNWYMCFKSLSLIFIIGMGSWTVFLVEVCKKQYWPHEAMCVLTDCSNNAGIQLNKFSIANSVFRSLWYLLMPNLGVERGLLMLSPYHLSLWSPLSLRADSRFAPSQWETAFLCNGISHWLGANLESALSLFLNISGARLYNDAIFTDRKSHCGDKTTGTAVLVKWHFYVKTPPWALLLSKDRSF